MSKTISLRHIKRVGLVDWHSREWWARQNVRIWSQEHGAWWRSEAAGYTFDEGQAWVIDFPSAYDATKNCGPEKKISYFAVAPSPIGSEQP